MRLDQFAPTIFAYIDKMLKLLIFNRYKCTTIILLVKCPKSTRDKSIFSSPIITSLSKWIGTIILKYHYVNNFLSDSDSILSL